MYDMNPLIQKLRDNRKRLGINQTEFARRLGTSLATITRWERGNMVYTPDLRQLSLIADMFDTTVWELLTPNTTETVTNNESMTESEAPTAIGNNEETEGPEAESPAALIVNADDTQETASSIANDETPQEADVQNAVTPDETPRAVDALPIVSSNDEIPLGAASSEVPIAINADEEQGVSSDVQEETPSSIEGQNIVNVDEEMTGRETPEIVSHEETPPADEPIPEIISHDEPVEAPQSVMTDESASAPAADSEEAEKSLFPIINDETPQEADVPSIDGKGSAPDIPVDAPQKQATEAVMTDETTPDVEAASMEILELVISDETTSEAPNIITNDEITGARPASPIVKSDEFPTEDSPSQELFSIVTPEESQTALETTATESASPDISSIVSDGDPLGEQPETVICNSDDTSESVMNDEKASEGGDVPKASAAALHEEAPEELPVAAIVTSDEEPLPEASSAMNDETAIEEATAPEASSIVISDESIEGQPTPPIVTSDDAIEPAPIAEAEQDEQTEPPAEDNAAPELFSIIPPDETPRENDALIVNAGAELPQDLPVSGAPSIVNNDELQETPPDTSSEASLEQAPAATNTPPKPWETLGMSKAWYYRLRQQGRLEEYMKEKAKN